MSWTLFLTHCNPVIRQSNPIGSKQTDVILSQGVHACNRRPAYEMFAAPLQVLRLRSSSAFTSAQAYPQKAAVKQALAVALCLKRRRRVLVRSVHSYVWNTAILMA